MKKRLIYLLTAVCIFGTSLFTSCSKDDDPPQEDFLIVDLRGQDLGYEYYLTDGKVDVFVDENPTTHKPLVATVSDPQTEESINLFFNEQGLVNIIEIDRNYIVIGEYKEEGTSVAMVTRDNDILSFDDVQINWDADFYSAWNAETDTRVDWGKLGGLFLEELRPMMIGVGYGLKSAADFVTVLAPDPSVSFTQRRLALIGIAGNLGKAISEGIPDTEAGKVLSEFSDNLLKTQGVFSAAHDFQDGMSPTEWLKNYIQSEILDNLSEVVIDMGRKEENLELAQYVTETGSGQIQVTLRWNNVNDIDLWVVDPTNERIYWNDKNSASGGYLDYDNTYAYGPENIFWESTNLSGDFHVYVDHYSGNTSANYSIFIKAFGKTRTFQGTVSRNGNVHVASFNRNGIYAPSERSSTKAQREMTFPREEK